MPELLSVCGDYNIILIDLEENVMRRRIVHEISLIEEFPTLRFLYRQAFEKISVQIHIKKDFQGFEHINVLSTVYLSLYPDICGFLKGVNLYNDWITDFAFYGGRNKWFYR